MKDKDLINMLRIMSTADHGCSECTKDLYIKVLTIYPNKVNIVEKVWGESYPNEKIDWDSAIDLDEFLQDII